MRIQPEILLLEGLGNIVRSKPLTNGATEISTLMSCGWSRAVPYWLMVGGGRGRRGEREEGGEGGGGLVAEQAHQSCGDCIRCLSCPETSSGSAVRRTPLMKPSHEAMLAS